MDSKYLIIGLVGLLIGGGSIYYYITRQNGNLPTNINPTITLTHINETEIKVGSTQKILAIGADLSTGDAGHTQFFSSLRSKGYTVDSLSNDSVIDIPTLSNYGVLIIAGNRNYGISDGPLIADWVKKGGNILLLANNLDETRASWCNPMLDDFGIVVNNDNVQAPFSTAVGYIVKYIYKHAITNGITNIVVPVVQGTHNTGSWTGPVDLTIDSSKATMVAQIGESGYSSAHAIKPPVLAVYEGTGKVVVISGAGDYTPFSNAYLSYAQIDNLQLGINIIGWFQSPG
jgi:hypothetical protein